MNPVIAIHMQSLVEHIRLLEAVVTAPLGLYSDIKMLRESLPLADAADLPRHELRARRIAYGSLHADTRQLALDAAASLTASLDILEAAHDDADTARLRDGWISRARMVLSRAEAQAAGDMRADIARPRARAVCHSGSRIYAGQGCGGSGGGGAERRRERTAVARQDAGQGRYAGGGARTEGALRRP